MDKHFNTAGPGTPDLHDLIDPLTRSPLDEIEDLIEQRRSFVLHAPRQTASGKPVTVLRGCASPAARIALGCNSSGTQTAVATYTDHCSYRSKPMPVDVTLLSRFYALDSLRAEHQDALAREAELVELQAGVELFAAGDTDEVTWYLLSGEVFGSYPDGRTKTVSADSLQSRYPVGDLLPRRYTAAISSASARLIRLDRRFTEKVIAWDQVTRSTDFRHYDPNPEGNRWVFRLLSNKALRRLPSGNIERLFNRFEEIRVSEGQRVIREGDDGDFFYVIKDGAASVSQTSDADGSEAVVAYLVRGDSFGEDALLSNSVRNASVIMLKPGRLMRLGKSDFLELLKQPVVEWLTPGKASILARQGAGVIDVRLTEEFDQRAIKGALSMPLYRLREHTTSLDKARKYVVYCNTGERSAAAAFILNKLGFEAYALQGGLSAMLKQMERKG